MLLSAFVHIPILDVNMPYALSKIDGFDEVFPSWFTGKFEHTVKINIESPFLSLCRSPNIFQLCDLR